MGIFDEIGDAAKDFSKAVLAASSKDDILANRLWLLLANSGFKMDKSSGSQSSDINKATFTINQYTIEVEVRGPRASARTQVKIGGMPTGNIPGLSATICEIKITAFQTGISFLDKVAGKGVKKFSFKINADEYIDNNLKIVNTQTLDNALKQFVEPLNTLKIDGRG